jgi:hypothetical protein
MPLSGPGIEMPQAGRSNMVGPVSARADRSAVLLKDELQVGREVVRCGLLTMAHGMQQEDRRWQWLAERASEAITGDEPERRPPGRAQPR